MPPLIKIRPTVLTDGHHTTLTSPHIGLDCTSGDWWRGSLSQGGRGAGGGRKFRAIAQTREVLVHPHNSGHQFSHGTIE